LKVIVFGAAGFVGRNLILGLSNSDHSTIACDAVENPFDPEIKYLRLDVLDRARVFDSVKGNDAVIHLAASPLVASLQDPSQNMRVNIEGTLNILDAAREHHVKKLLYSSASSVIGTPNYNPVDEGHPCTPKTPYAVAKKACEDYIRVYRDLYDLHYVIFRFFNLYGPWQFFTSGALIPNVYRTLSENKEFRIFGDGSSRRDFIYIDDVVNYCLSALTLPIADTVVNLGTGIGTSILELVRLGSG
jgi:UDP-glucose 4-epimerase